MSTRSTRSHPRIAVRSGAPNAANQSQSEPRQSRLTPADRVWHRRSSQCHAVGAALARHTSRNNASMDTAATSPSPDETLLRRLRRQRFADDFERIAAGSAIVVSLALLSLPLLLTVSMS